MKVTPVASPHAVSQPMQVGPNTDTRSKAIAAFNAAQQPQQAPVQNQNAVTPEEMGAIKPQEQLAEAAQQATEIAEQVDAKTPIETTEETAETPEVKPKVDPTVSRQFAQLARQEKALRAKAQQQEQSIRAREEALQAKEAKITGLEQQYKSGYISMDQLKADTLSVLANAGVSYDELTQQILNQQPTDPRLNAHIARLEAQIKSLESKAEEGQKTAQEQQKSAYEAAIRQIKMDTKALVSSDPTYETIKATGSINDVVELIEQTYQKDGIVLSVEEAATEVENYLVEEALKITNIDKIKKRLSQASAQSQKVQEKSQAPAAKPQSQPMKTLTNATASTRKLSAKERAILAFKGELKG